MDSDVEQKALLLGKDERPRQRSWSTLIVVTVAIGIGALAFFTISARSHEPSLTEIEHFFNPDQYLRPSYPASYCEAETPDPSTFEEPSVRSYLRAIQVVVRHGDRTPCTVDPKDDVEWLCDEGEYYFTNGLVSRVKYDTAEYDWKRKFWKGNCADGQLTPRGFAQLFRLGDQIFATYGSRMPINISSVVARSTIVPRARQSAQAFLWGLLKQNYTSEVFDVRTSPYHKRSDIMLGSELCPRLRDMQTDYRTTPEWKSHIQANTALRSRLEQAFETKDNAQWQDEAFDKYFDALQARLCHAQPLPCTNNVCLSEDDRAATVKLGEWEWDYRFNRYRVDDKARLEMGPMLHVITTTFQQILAGQANTGAFRLYSGHDDTVSPLLSALGIHLPWPPYASNVIFELWQPVSGAAPFVRLRYNGKLMAMAGCAGVECPLTSFAAFVEPWASPEAYAANCAKPL